MLSITGATGLVGGFLIEELKRQNIDMSSVNCLVRNSSPNLEEIRKSGVNLILGDIKNKRDLKALINGSEIVVHIVHISYSKSVLEVSEELGVRKVIFIHTTGIYSKNRDFCEKYKQIEQDILKRINIEYVILRPTMIYGSLKDKNMHKLIEYIGTKKMIPIFGKGKNLMQPIHGLDIARSIVEIISRDIKNKEYNIAGKEPIEYGEIIKFIAKNVNPQIKILNIPYHLSIVLGYIYERVCKVLNIEAKVSIEQIKRINEDKNFSFEEASTDFGFAPTDFKEGILDEIKQLGLLKENR